jgi:3'(2'), 5'-bisphosphate nucleotidase
VSESPDKWLVLAIESAHLGGEETLRFYKEPVSTETKADGSPVTAADRAAHDAIINHLAESQIPIISEEGSDLLLNESEYWLVDPLDGTKDFIHGDDEFSVNVALIRNQRPVLGVVYAPAINELYCGVDGTTSWRELNGTREDSTPHPKSQNLRMAVSRFHDTPELDIFAEKNNVAERVPLGSVLKYCRMAMGDLDVVPRLVGTSEWDTAAGQAVVEGAGGSVLDWHTGESLRYGKPNRRNPRFLAYRSPYTLDHFKLKHYEPELL